MRILNREKGYFKFFLANFFTCSSEIISDNIPYTVFKASSVKRAGKVKGK